MPSEFESMFSDMGYAFLQQSGLNLDEYLVGFEIIEKNEAGTKALGIFVLKINDKYYYVPQFFNNGELKPLIMIYDKSADKMLPLDDEWIEYFESKKFPVLGETHDKPKNVGGDVNISYMMQPPFTNKIASQKLFPEVLKKASSEAKQVFLNKMRHDRTFLKAMVENYDMGVIKEACMATPGVAREKQAEVRLIEDMEELAGKPVELKCEFLKKGYAIEAPNIMKEWPAEIKEFRIDNQTHNPRVDGEYELLTSKGKKKCIILLAPKNLGTQRNEKKTIVIDKSSKDYGYCEPINVVVVDDNQAGHHPKPPKNGFISPDKMTVNNRYILFNMGKSRDYRGRGTMPFHVHGKTSSDGETFFKASCGCENFNIIIKKTGSCNFIGKDVAIPKDSYKAMKLGEQGFDIIGKPGVAQMLYENYHHYKFAGDKLFINEKHHKTYVNIKEAEFDLVKNHRFSKEAAHKYVYTNCDAWVKKAYSPYPIEGHSLQAGLPALPDSIAPGGLQELTYDDTPVEGLMTPSELQSTETDIRGPDANINEEIQKALQLSEMGDKDIFDKALVGVLANINDVSSEIRSYIPDFFNALDKLGRMLFVMWYKGDKIKDKFSISEYSQTEDLLKDTFKSLGKLVLTFKKKYAHEDVA
jgi:hypothetical protein